MSGISQTVGIDLGSKPKKTAVCRIEWSPDGGCILPAEETKPTNDGLKKLISDPAVEHVGIDAPFGWPSDFLESVNGYALTGRWPKIDQLSLRFRQTDLHVKKVTGVYPLSVTSDFLVFLGWRCAEIFSDLPEWSIESRRGDGRLIEVYPSGSMNCWGISPKTWTEDPGPYKGDSPSIRSRRERLVALIEEQASGRLDFDGHEHRFIESDDELDALVAALTARAVSQGLAEPIPSGLDDIVLKEGWIRLPNVGSTLEEVCL